MDVLLKQRFSIPVLAPPPLCIFCMSLFVNTPDSDNHLVRSALRAWTVSWLTCSLHRVHCSLHRVHCSLHRVHCSLHSVHCSLHRVHCSLHSVHCYLHRVHCSLHSVHCSLHRVHCSLHSVHCSLHRVHCSLLPEQGNLLKFTLFRNIHSWICAAQRLHARTSVTSYTSVNIYNLNSRLAHFNALWMEYIRSLRTGIMAEYPDVHFAGHLRSNRTNIWSDKSNIRNMQNGGGREDWNWYHYLLSPSTVFCTSYCFLHILLFCTFYIAHFTLISLLYLALHLPNLHLHLR